MRVAYVHDWLVTYRGGEKVLESLLSLYPDAPIYTLFYDSKHMPEAIRSRNIIAPRWLKGLFPFRKWLLPILPSVVESFPMEEYDLIISTSSCVAKGVMTGPDATHICYLHSPMRYIWDQRQHYLSPKKWIPGYEFLFHYMSRKLRQWDVVSSNRVDRFVVNSAFVGQRVKKYYRRNSVVIHPPIDTKVFSEPRASDTSSKYLLAAGAFVSYKRFDLAIKACERLGKKLILAGSGPEEKNLRQIAGPNTSFVIAPGNEKWSQLMSNAEALLFPGVEDFGMIAIEAMASGTPVLAYKGGGALDFIQPRVTGGFFEKQTPESLSELVSGFNRSSFDSGKIREYAETYSESEFLQKFKDQIDSMVRSKTIEPES